MVVEEECEMVVDEIFSGDTYIKRIPVFEGMTELVEGFPGDGGGFDVLTEEDVIPYIVGHFCSRDVGRAKFTSVDGGVEEMGDGVVGHIDCRIG